MRRVAAVLARFVALLAPKVLRLGAVLLVISAATFSLMHALPGSPDKVIVLAIGPQADQLRARIRHDLELDKPVPQQYVNYVNKLVHGDLGENYNPREPVSKILADKLPPTLLLMLYAQVLALAMAIPLAVLSAHRSGTWVDRCTSGSAFALLAVPPFVLALLLQLWLTVRSHAFPFFSFSHSYVSPLSDPNEHFRNMFLPTVALAAGQVAIYLRLLRSDLIATLQEDFITMAKSKGIPPRRVLWRHALRPSSLTLLTVAGLNVGTLIGGAVVVETIFKLPGIGFELAQGIIAHEYVKVQSLVLIIAAAYVLMNFLVDSLYVVLDPRIRYARATG